MIVMRILLTALLAWLAFLHADMWGRMFMNLQGMKTPAEVSPAYYNPVKRLLFFPGCQVVLLACAWAVFPFSHWGLLAIAFSAYAFKSGMRCELLRSFVRQLLMHLDKGSSLDIAWQESINIITSLTGMKNIGVERYLC